ncbi:MAG: RNA-guided endonuclease TnpB family protein [Thermaerobacter sp.]|nr:RNA-guided endonuclease TnpB family protein [Thermaerobacter sp.]
MLMAHRIALNPNRRQATYFAKAAGTARFAYNWALAEWDRQYTAHREDASLPAPSQGALRRQLNAIKRTEFPWMLEVTKNAPQMAIIQLGQAFQNFFAGRARRPRCRRKGVDDHFTLTNDQFCVAGRRIRIPNLGWVRMREKLRFQGKIVSATISRSADRWFVSITVETDQAPKRPAEHLGAVGVDLGVLTLATLSTGERIPGPRVLRKRVGQLRRLSRSLSRKQRGSKNRAKARAKLARLHARIADIRLDSLHKLTSDLARRFDVIGIEDLNVRGMVRNHRLARSIADMGLRELRRQLEYKAARRGAVVVVADRFFPSSKRCSACGYIQNEMPLSVRLWTCPACRITHDRDLNAAVNLAQYAVSSTVSACGGEGSGDGHPAVAKPAPAKQEVSAKIPLRSFG